MLHSSSWFGLLELPEAARLARMRSKSTLKSFQGGLLPSTHQDAVRFVRKALKHQLFALSLMIF